LDTAARSAKLFASQAGENLCQHGLPEFMTGKCRPPAQNHRQKTKSITPTCIHLSLICR